MADRKADIVILGGSAAGLAAALTAAHHNPKRKVLVVSKKENAPGGEAPYVLGAGGVREQVLQANNIAFLTDEVERLDPIAAKLELQSGDTLYYDRLILAVGSMPAMTPIAGFEKENIRAVHNEAPLFSNLRQQWAAVKDLVVIGGNCIGLEFADQFKKAGVSNVTVVEAQPHCLMLSFDENFAAAADQLLTDAGIGLRTSAKVEAFRGGHSVEQVKLTTGETLKADAVIISIGASANVYLAKEAGLKIGTHGAIDVDRNMKTSNDRIYACGDCAEKTSFFGGRHAPLRMASIAAAEARVAGANLYNSCRENIGAIGVWNTVAGGAVLACAGLTEKAAKETGIACVVGEVETKITGAPGLLRTKLIFERRTSMLLGGQLLGDATVGEMVNTLSICIQKRLTFDDIAVFQLGTYPAHSGSPLFHQLITAAEIAQMNARK